MNSAVILLPVIRKLEPRTFLEQDPDGEIMKESAEGMLALVRDKLGEPDNE